MIRLLKALCVALLFIAPAAHAAVSASNLTHGGTAGGVPATTQTTASVSPTANALIQVSVSLTWFNSTPQPAVSTITGNGLTWVNVATYTDTTEHVQVEIWRSMGASPTTGAITINLNNTGVAAWSVDQWTGVDTSGTNGSGAIVQTVANSGRDLSGTNPNTAPTLTFGSGIGASNAVAAFFSNGSGVAGTGVGGYTTLATDITNGALSISSLSRVPGTTTPTVSVATGSFEFWQGIADEVKAAAPALSLIPVIDQHLRQMKQH